MLPPESYDEEFIDEWAAWVLDHGLPASRHVPAVGEACPIARWRGPELGAVLFVAWDGDGSSLIGDVQVLRRHDSGWEASGGSGGAGWFDPPYTRPSGIAAEHVDLISWGGFESSPDWRFERAYGIAGSAACWVEVFSNGVSTRFPIEVDYGAFVVAWDPSVTAEVRVLDRTGGTLWSHLD